MKPLLLIGVAVAAVLGVAAIAFAATGGGNDDNAAQVASPTPTTSVTDETPMPVEPDGGIGSSETPIPVEPDGGIGDGAGPIPVEPNGGIGDTPLPVEPDGGIGDTPVGAETPMPSEPIIPVAPAPTQPSLPAGRYAEAAPIDQLDVAIAESYPPQYFVHILAGLPSGCAEQYTHSFTRNGDMIEVEVLNSFPEGNPACTAIYGEYELNIALGSDFTPGQTYTVSVNGGAAETTFTAQ